VTFAGSPEQHSDEGQIVDLLPDSKTKKRSMYWVEKGQPCPIEAGVLATRSKQAVLVDARGITYTMSQEQTVNATYIKKALAGFLVVFRKKEPIMSSHD
jgi:hypothetical protein